MSCRNLLLVVLLTGLVAEPSVAHAQLGRGGLIRRIFGRVEPPEEEEEEEEKKEPKEKRSAKEPESPSRTPAAEDTRAKRPPTKSAPKAPSTVFGINARFDAKRKVWVVQKVEKNSAASEAGLQSGDVIYRVAGVDVDDEVTLQGLQEVLSKGDRIDVELERKGKAEKVQLYIEDGPEKPKPNVPTLAPKAAEIVPPVEELSLSSGDELSLDPVEPEFVDLGEPESTSILQRPSPSTTNDSIATLRQMIEEQAAIIKVQNAEIERLRRLTNGNR